MIHCRFFVRGNEQENETYFYGESWYFGGGVVAATYSITWPAFLLTLSHFLIWAIIFAILYRFSERIGHFALRYFAILPLTLLVILTAFMVLFGLEFNSAVAGISEITGRYTDTMGYHYQGVSMVGLTHSFTEYLQISK